MGSNRDEVPSGNDFDNNLSVILHSLQRKYLRAEGLMLNSENKLILMELTNEINIAYDSLMLRCVSLSDKDLLSGTGETKLKVVEATREFDARLGEWFVHVELANGRSYSKAQTSRFTSQNDFRDDQSGCSGRTRRSNISSASFKHKESMGRLRLAVYAKQIEVKRSTG